MPTADITKRTFSKEMMHAAHELNGPSLAHKILTTAELVAALPYE